jgi:hypothetical protein
LRMSTERQQYVKASRLHSLFDQTLEVRSHDFY